MDIKYPVENEYMKCVLQINGFSDLRPRVWSNRRVGSSRGGGGGGGGWLRGDRNPNIWCVYRSSGIIRDHKDSIGWALADLKGIQPSMCLHLILLDDGHKPSLEA